MPEERSRLVYSTDGTNAGRIKPPEPPRRAPSRPPSQKAGPPIPDDGYVRLRREKGGRGGKTVTTITGLPGGEADLEARLRVLKQLCGAGGSREGATLEIQGDHRERVQAKLESLGHRVKLAGG